MRTITLILVMTLATGCRFASRPEPAAKSGFMAFGLPLESILCLDLTLGSPDVTLVGYETHYRQRDSLVVRRELEGQLGRAGYQPRRAPEATTGLWVLVIPLYRDVKRSCADFEVLRASGLLFERRGATIDAPPA